MYRSAETTKSGHGKEKKETKKRRKYIRSVPDGRRGQTKQKQTNKTKLNSIKSSSTSDRESFNASRAEVELGRLIGR